MVWAAQSKSSLSIQTITEQIIELGQLSRQEHLQLTSVMLSDSKLSNQDRRRINLIFDYLQTGRLKLAD
jgi:DNA integrity scanning protein DisA with diadenylate cyclase activity